MARQLSNISQKENIHRRAQWIDRFLQKQETKLSSKNLQLLYNYNDDMIIASMADNTRYKNLTHYGLLTKMLQKDWADVTEKDIRELVSQIMIKHGENGKETGYTSGLKISIKSIVRFVKLGSRNKPEDGELPMIKFINPKNPKDKLTREDLPTDEESKKFLILSFTKNCMEQSTRLKLIIFGVLGIVCKCMQMEPCLIGQKLEKIMQKNKLATWN